MPASLIVLTDLVPPPDASVERMPALERLLARSDAAGRTTGDWRSWVQMELGLPLPPGSPPLADVARGQPGHWAFATPVHLLAGLDSLHLHPSVPQRLSTEEQGELIGAFADTFGPELTLEFDAQGTAYLRLPRAIDASSHDPLAAVGRAVGDWLPSGPGSAWLTRLATEIQMWLHSLPLNAAREARGELPVNALWLWGVSSSALPTVPEGLPVLWSSDPYLNGLWRLGGCPCAGVAEDSESWLGDAPQSAVITLSLSRAGATPAQADAHWFAPLARTLARPRASAWLWAAGREFRLAGAQRLRLWRRTRPWHQVLAA